MKLRTTPLLLAAAAAALCSVVPAAASSIVGDQKIKVDCRGYTVTFDGTGFGLTGDEINITWQGIQLAQDGVTLPPYGGAATMTAASGATTASVSEFRPWGVPMCGKQNVVDVRFPPARYDWLNNHGGSGAGVFRFPDGTQVFYLPECPCDEPGDEICRTPGFWGTHAGAEKSQSQNITQAVINANGGAINVCGKTLTSTDVAKAFSALEGICVSPKGEQRLQLARQLTAAALNCVMSGGGDECTGIGIGATFASCNQACADGDVAQYGHCVDAIDCFNNGGKLLDNGLCQLGTCAGGTEPCDEDAACGLDAAGAQIACVPLPGNCHEQPLVNADLGLSFDPPGPAGSSKACNDANKNTCNIFNCPAGK